MNCFKKALIGSAFALAATSAFAAPTHLITNNQTDAKIHANIGGGTGKSEDPVRPHEERHRAWALVQLKCATKGQFTDCSASIGIEEQGKGLVFFPKTITLNLQTGKITPKHSEVNGYSLDVNDSDKDPHVTITKK